MTRFHAHRKPPVRPQGGWLQASYEATWMVEDLTNREDLVVKISPDAGFDDSAYDANGDLILTPKIDDHGEPVMKDGEPVMIPAGEQHPGVTFPQLGIIEINAHYFPENIDPHTIHPLERKNRNEYPVGMGILVHEAAHSQFTLWMEALQGKDLSEEDQKAAGAAILLEEARIEYRQMRTRPANQKWLQASAMKVAIDDVASGIRATKKMLDENPELAANIDIDKVRVSRAAALVLARVDGGSVYESDETRELETMVRDVFGDEGHDRLRQIWLDSFAVADDDTDAMMELGRRWYEETGDSGQDSSEGEGGEGDGDQLEGMLASAADNAVKEASGQADKDRRKARIQERVKQSLNEAQQRRQAEQKAKSVLAGSHHTGRHPVTGYRNPTGAEMALARATRRKLQAAYVPERAVTMTTRALPPGKLSVRSAMQLDAQKEAGLLPDVEPFRFKDRRHVVTPPLKVGIIQDVSGSQDSAAAAAVSGAWSLVRATQMIEDAQVSMVSFGDAVHKIVGPREKMAKVPVISANSGTHYFLDSVRAIEGILDLTRGGSARLLVILTDGYLMEHDLQGRDAALKRLTEYGVKILWMVTDGDGDEEHTPGRMPGVHVFRQASGQYDVIPRVITHEAVQALVKLCRAGGPQG